MGKNDNDTNNWWCHQNDAQIRRTGCFYNNLVMNDSNDSNDSNVIN